MLLASTVIPAWFAALHAPNVADAPHDEGVIRSLGLGWTGVWRALDVAVSSVFMALPLGTRASRAGLACALVLAVAGALVYLLTRRILAACADAPRFGAMVSAAAALTATLGPVWQLESTSAGGSVTGALLMLAPLVLLTPGGAPRPERIPLSVAVAGLAFGYEPLAGACSLGALVVTAIAAWYKDRPNAPWKRIAITSAALFAFGLIPAATSLIRLGSASGLGVWVLEAWRGEGSGSVRAPLEFVSLELGWILTGFAVFGLGLAALVARARPLGAGLAALATFGLACTQLGVPAGPVRYAAPLLAAVAAVAALSGVALQSIVRLVARARIPFARASAAMVIVLELTFPVQFSDAAVTRASGRARGASAAWDDVAWGPLPPFTVVLVDDARVMRRVLASRAQGAARGDLAIIPLYDLNSSLARRELAREPKLAGFWRDMATFGRPEEFSLSDLASSRPLAMMYEPAWDRTLTRHLVPVGLVARFEPEPRGASDRRRALDAFLPARDRLVKELSLAYDEELVQATAVLLRSRAIAFTATGDKDVPGRALEDVTAFVPHDEVAEELIRRLAAKKGGVEVKDLRL
jgi:hypothetical protein